MTGTIESGAYRDVFNRLAPGIQLYSQPCPLFVLIVENGLVGSPEAVRVAEEYLRPLKIAGIDTLILGCTHYPLMSDVIEKVMGPGVKLISSAEETAREAKRILGEKGLLRGGIREASNRRFFVSGPAKPFADLAQNLIGGTIRFIRLYYLVARYLQWISAYISAGVPGKRGATRGEFVWIIKYNYLRNKF